MMTNKGIDSDPNKQTNEITSKQVLEWARRVEEQRAQKALIETMKENEEINVVKKQQQENNILGKTKACKREM